MRAACPGEPASTRYDCPVTISLPVLAQASGFPPEAKEHCGVFAIWGEPEPARHAYFGLVALQHRGQESAGIAVTNGSLIERHAAMGLVSSVFSANELSGLDAHTTSVPPSRIGAIGHNRYSTTGSSIERNAQPFVGHYSGGQVAIGHNGNIVNALALRKRLEEAGHAFHTSSDTEVVLHLLASCASAGSDDPLADALRQLQGAFSLVFLFEDRIEIARDPWGWRPLTVGVLPSGSPAAASEDVALHVIGAEVVRDVEPGEIVTLSADGISARRFAPPASPLAQCVFEHVYFASPASRIFGQTVQRIRERLGARLAEEAPVPADLVMAMPDSGRSAATGYAVASDIPYREGIIPNRYVGRTFIKPTDDERATAVRLKLNIISDVVRGQRCIVVDDSIVRGTTTRTKMDQLRAAGAREIHLRIASPPIRHPCYFGVDFPDRRQLVAAERNVEQIRRMLNVDTLHYLTLDGLLDVVATGERPAADYCTACYSGKYPIEVPEGIDKNAMNCC